MPAVRFVVLTIKLSYIYYIVSILHTNMDLYKFQIFICYLLGLMEVQKKDVMEYLVSTFGKIQSVRMKGIQNKIIISQKAFIIHINGLHHYKGKLLKFFLRI
jgi:hypothetical protein